MKANWRTAWQGPAIVVWRDEVEVDRLDSAQIRRVVFVHRGVGDSPGDVVGALVRSEADWVVLPASTGFGGRVHFERQAFWAERACVFWVPESRAPLPPRLRRNRWLPHSAEPVFARVPAAELDGLVDGWLLEGPQSWEERKWLRIERSRPLANLAEQRKRA